MTMSRAGLHCSCPRCGPLFQRGTPDFPVGAAEAVPLSYTVPPPWHLTECCHNSSATTVWNTVASFPSDAQTTLRS